MSRNEQRKNYFPDDPEMKDMSGESQKVVIAYRKGYRVDKDGVVTSSIGNILNLNGDRKRQYATFSVKFAHLGYSSRVYVHKLQAYQKFGPSAFVKGIEVRHLNGDNFDNRYDNIEIGTHSDNEMDRPPEERKRKAAHASEFNANNLRLNIDAVFHDFFIIGLNMPQIAEKWLGSRKSKSSVHHAIKKADYSQHLREGEYKEAWNKRFPLESIL